MAVSPSVSAVVFDVGGVLLDWDPRYLYRRLLPDEQAVEWFLREVCTQEWNMEQDHGRSWAEAVAQLTERFPQHAALVAAYHERWQEAVAGPIAGSVEVLGRPPGRWAWSACRSRARSDWPRICAASGCSH